MNQVVATITGNELVFGALRLPVPPLERQPSGNKVILGMRPESFSLAGDADADARATVGFVENFGSDKYLHIKFDGLTDRDDFIIRAPNTTRFADGDSILIRVDRDALHLFDEATGERIVK